MSNKKKLIKELEHKVKQIEQDERDEAKIKALEKKLEDKKPQSKLFKLAKQLYSKL